MFGLRRGARACVYIYMLHIHTYIHTYIHACMHTYIHIQMEIRV